MRKNLTIVISAWTLLLSAISAAQDPVQAIAEAQIRQVNRQLIQAFLHRDAVALDRLLADEYNFTDDDGRFLGKRHILQSFRSGDHHIFSFDVSEQQVRVYGTAAVMTYRYTCKQTYKNQDVSGVFRITRVFARKHGRWQIVAGHESRVASALQTRPRPPDTSYRPNRLIR
jgi:ketosteroid isomerase-like protein